MDKSIALELQSSIDRTDMSIRSAARYFGYYRSDAPEIAGLFLNEIANANSPSKKILLVYVVHEIILSTYDKGDEFIKGYGDRLRMMVDQINGTNEMSCIKSLMDLMQLWENKGFYSKNFMGKMRDILQKKLDSIKNESKKKDQNSESQKGLLKDYKLVQEYDNSKELFLIRQKENVISKEMKKLDVVSDLQKNNNTQANKTEAKIKLKENESNFEDIAIKLKEVINEYANIYKNISQEAEQEQDTLKQFNLNEYDVLAKEVALLKEKFD